MEEKATKITKENYKEIARRCVELTLKLGRPVYFNIAFWELDTVSACYFTPMAPVEKDGHRIWMVFPLDYEKILAMLLSHPKVSKLYFDEQEGAIKVIFEVPEDYMEEADAW